MDEQSGGRGMIPELSAQLTIFMSNQQRPLARAPTLRHRPAAPTRRPAAADPDPST